MKLVKITPLVGLICLAVLVTGCDILFPKGDTEPPTAEITAPIHGSTIYDVAKITADASDNIAVLKVSFYVDGEWVGDDESAPYEFDWNCKELVSGEYNLRVTAFDEEGNKGDSEAVTVYVVGKVTATGSADIAAPSNLTAAVNSDGDIELSWTDNSDNEEGFGIFYNTEESFDTSTVIGLADANAESYVDTYDFTEGTTYYYFVVAYKDDAEVISDASNWASVVYSLLSTPGNVTASQGQYYDGVLIGWDSVSTANSYNIYRSETSDGSYTYLGYVDGTYNSTLDMISSADTSISRGAHYFYKVSAVDSSSTESSLSTAAEGWTMPYWNITDGNDEYLFITGNNVDKGLVHYRSFNNTDLTSSDPVVVDVRKTSGDSDGLFGIVFRYEDSSNYCLFMINSNGYYTVWEYEGGAWNTPNPVSLTLSSHINTETNSSNTLKIIKSGSGYFFYINDNEVNSHSFSDSITPETVGFVAEVTNDEDFITPKAVKVYYAMTRPELHPSGASKNLQQYTNSGATAAPTR
ncbi:MAG: Ig-like domain-containing protein [Spirochaetia bacterium]